LEERVADTEELFAKGVAIRDEMLGSEHGKAKVEGASDFTREFEDLVTRYCFAEIWGREQLSRANRSMLTIGMLIAMGRSSEIRTHVKGAITNGVSKDEIREVILHSTVYCGVPAALEAFKVAGATLDELGVA
jgi:4-carboxymuconolactone decarboxylase